MTIQCKIGNLSHPDVILLLQEHLDDMHMTSPSESVHALNLSQLKNKNISFFTLWEKEQLLACVAINEISQQHAEIKSMRVANAARGKGLGKRLLKLVFKVSIERNYQRISLETGTQVFFEPARHLYKRFGFTECEPFGTYTKDPNSVCMTINLRSIN